MSSARPPAEEPVKFCALDPAACVALVSPCGSSVSTPPQPLLDAVDHLCHQVEGDPAVQRQFFAASTPEEMVDLAVEAGIFIGIDDFRALLTSGSTECWLVRGDANTNPIAHLQQVFAIPPCALQLEGR